MATSVKIGLYVTFGLGIIDIGVCLGLRFLLVKLTLSTITLASLSKLHNRSPSPPQYLLSHADQRVLPPYPKRLLFQRRPLHLSNHRLSAATPTISAHRDSHFQRSVENGRPKGNDDDDDGQHRDRPPTDKPSSAKPRVAVSHTSGSQSLAPGKLGRRLRR